MTARWTSSQRARTGKVNLHERSGLDDRIFGWRNNMFSNGRGDQVMMKILDGDVVREDRVRRTRRLAEGWRSIGC